MHIIEPSPPMAAASPPPSPPHPKRPKISSSSDPEPKPSSPSAAGADPAQPRRRYKRHKVAILFGYCGAGYQGMQKNPGAGTIEGDLEEALYQAGAVPEADRAVPRRYDWALAARIDKGVSTATQVVSGRFYVDPPGFADRLNAQLAPQIRAFGYVRVTNWFNAKKFCDRRRYVYLLPVFVLDPSAHPDREAVMASVGSGNELAKSVECSKRGRKVGDLEEALYQAGAVPEADRAAPQRYDWARAARTDKGVSAAAQVVSGRFYVDPPGFADRLNAQLAPQIRAFGYVRVTNSFNAKKFCDRRRYVYLLPVFVLDPSAHPDREAVMASVGSGNELAKSVECSERGRKVPDVIGREGEVPNPEVENVIDAYGEETVATHGELGSNGDAKCDPTSSAGVTGTRHGEIGSSGNVKIDLPSSGNGNEAQNAELGSNGAEKCDIEPSGGTFNSEAVPAMVSETFCSNPIAGSADAAASIVAEKEHNFEPVVSEEEKLQAMDVEKSNGEEMPLKKSTFSYTDEVKERFNRILKYYVGTHNFHNFTTRTKAEDPAAKRFIISFTADRVVSLDGIDFVRCEVVGQSFMLHQIRKMIGLAVAVMRNCAPESIYDVAFRKDSHEAVSMEPYSEEAEEFKIKYIFSHFAAMEHKEGAVALWLHSLNSRNYPDFRYMETAGSEAGVGTVVESIEEAQMPSDNISE